MKRLYVVRVHRDINQTGTFTALLDPEDPWADAVDLDMSQQRIAWDAPLQGESVVDVDEIYVDKLKVFQVEVQGGKKGLFVAEKSYQALDAYEARFGTRRHGSRYIIEEKEIKTPLLYCHFCSRAGTSCECGSGVEALLERRNSDEEEQRDINRERVARSPDLDDLGVYRVTFGFQDDPVLFVAESVQEALEHAVLWCQRRGRWLEVSGVSITPIPRAEFDRFSFCWNCREGVSGCSCGARLEGTLE